MQKNEIHAQVANLISQARQEGYDEGYNTAVQLIMASISSNKGATLRSAPKHVTPSNDEMAGLHLRPLREGSTAEKICEYIKANPGQTGVEIVRGVQKIDRSINERTIRTAFNRLQGKRIRKNRKKWYPL